MPFMLNVGLVVGCIIIGILMLAIGGWFCMTGVKDRDWSTVVLAIMVLGVAGFAFYSAYYLVTW